MSRYRTWMIAALAAVCAAGVGYGVANAVSPPVPNGPSSPTPTRGLSPQFVAASAPTESVYVPVTNCRLVHTSVAGGMIPNGSTRNFYVVGVSANFASQGGPAGGCGIPASATAISARVTANSALANGVFIAYPTGTPVGQGTLYYAKGINVSSGATLQLGPGIGQVLTVKNLKGPAQLVIDVNGYYAPQMSAFVNTNGSLGYTTGRVTASVRTSPGIYTVVFDRDVSKCSLHATTYDLNRVIAVGPGYQPKEANVFIHDEASPRVYYNTSFFITAIC